jgi:hypothetical protein
MRATETVSPSPGGGAGVGAAFKPKLHCLSKFSGSLLVTTGKITGLIQTKSAAHSNYNHVIRSSPGIGRDYYLAPEGICAEESQRDVTAPG